MNMVYVIDKCVNAETGAMKVVAAFSSEYEATAWAETQDLQGRYAGSNGKWRTDYYECHEVSIGEFTSLAFISRRL
jgi:hypothetical protein